MRAKLAKVTKGLYLAACIIFGVYRYVTHNVSYVKNSLYDDSHDIKILVLIMGLRMGRPKLQTTDIVSLTYRTE